MQEKAGRIISDTVQYVIFKSDKQRFALQLAAVERTVRAVAITPLPNAPAQILGMVNVGGNIMPVVSMRKICGLPERELDINDQFVIMRNKHSSLALVVDEVSGVESYEPHEIIGADTILPGLDRMKVIVRNDGGIIILYDPDMLLNPEEIAQLEDGLRGTS